MLPFIEIFGKTVPMYAVMAFLGAAAMCAVSAAFARVRKNVPAEDIFYMLLYAGIGCLIGAKLLYLIISVDVYWLTDKSFTENMKYWVQLLMSGGLVFYGGLIGAFLGALRYCRHFKIPFEDSVETVIPTVPLFHAFGRIGCFCAGCCYGMEYDGIFSVTFKNSLGAPNGIPLLPIQLIEASGNFLLFVLLALLFVRNNPRLSLSGLYLVCYSVMRFILEFFRGDIIRGKAMGISTSQWISVFVFAAGIILIVRKAKTGKISIQK